MSKPKILQQLNAEASSQILLKTDPDVAMEAATKQYVDNSGGIFYAIHGTTTYEEVVEAFNQGKAVKALYSDDSYVYIFDLVTRPTSSTSYLSFVVNYPSQDVNKVGGYSCSLDTSSRWGDIIPSGAYHTSGYLYHSGYSVPISNSTRYYRPILTSLYEPTSSDGKIGDIWVVYNNE